MSRANEARYRWAVAPGREQRLPILATFWNLMIAELIVGKTLNGMESIGFQRRRQTRRHRPGDGVVLRRE